MLEHHKSMSTQPRSQTTMVTLYKTSESKQEIIKKERSEGEAQRAQNL